MKYPKKLAKRADEILAARRWDAERRQAHRSEERRVGKECRL